MKRLGFYILLVLLFGLSIGSIFYKTEILRLPLLPPKSTDGWSLQFEIRTRHAIDGLRNAFPVPQTDKRQSVTLLNIDPKGVEISEHPQDGGLLLTWGSDENSPDIIRVNYQVTVGATKLPEIKESGSTGPRPDLKAYLTPSQVSPAIEDKLAGLEESLFIGKDKITNMRAIYYWISEEIVLNDEVDDLEEALILSNGSRLQRAKLFTLLARRGGIPARTVAAVRLRDPKRDGAVHQFLTYYNEIYVDRKWYPVDVNRRKFGEVPANFVVLHKDWESLEETLAHKNAAYTILGEPSRTDRLNLSSYVERLDEEKSILTMFSFHRLPLSTQGIFYTILMIPFGAVLLSLTRNVIGLRTFGIFTPILLTLFFIETSLIFGIISFGLIVCLGFFQRYILDRFHLLAVPRLSILLTLVIITFGSIALINHQYKFLPGGHTSLGYLPIVIITIFIERFSVHFIEEGAWNTLVTLLGTFFVAVLCYFLFQIQDLKLLIFTHPELLLVAVGLCIMIGSYKGYRLSEFFRFKDFSRL